MKLLAKDLPEVQAMLGHSNIKQTEQYAKVIALLGNQAPVKMAEMIGLTASEVASNA